MTVVSTANFIDLIGVVGLEPTLPSPKRALYQTELHPHTLMRSNSMTVRTDQVALGDLGEYPTLAVSLTDHRADVAPDLV